MPSNLKLRSHHIPSLNYSQDYLELSTTKDPHYDTLMTLEDDERQRRRLAPFL